MYEFLKLTYDGQVDFGITSWWLFEIYTTLVHGRILVYDFSQYESGRFRFYAEICAAVQRSVVKPMGTAVHWFLTQRGFRQGGRCRRSTASNVVAEKQNNTDDLEVHNKMINWYDSLFSSNHHPLNKFDCPEFLIHTSFEVIPVVKNLEFIGRIIGGIFSLKSNINVFSVMNYKSISLDKRFYASRAERYQI